MAVVSMMKFSGDPDELAAKMNEHIRPVGTELGQKHGNLGFILARTGDGVLAINLWETEEGRQAMAQEPAVLAALQAAGLPAPGFEGYEILDITIRPEAVRG